MLDFLNKNGGTTADTSFYGSVFNLQDGHTQIVLKRMISASLNSLGYKDKWTNLYKDNLVNALYLLISSGNLKGYLYLDKDNTAIAFSHEKKKAGDLKIENIFRELEVDLKQSNTYLYQVIYTLCCQVNKLLEVGADTITLSRIITFKIDGARKNISNDYLGGILNRIKEAFNIATTNKRSVMPIDALDTIELLQNNLANIDKTTKDTLASYFSTYTGFPASFFSGEFQNGLGSTSANEENMTYLAIESLFYGYLKQFFDLIDYRIRPVKDLNISLRLSKDLIDLANFDDKIDIIEIYKQLGIPLKQRNSIDEI